MIDFSDDVAFNEFLEERIRVGHKFVALSLKKDAFLSSDQNSTLIKFLYKAIYFPIRIAPYKHLRYQTIKIEDCQSSESPSSLLTN